MIIAVGCGALNLDIIYEIDDLKSIQEAGFPLLPGRECVLQHEMAEELLKVLEKSASLLAKSGGGSAANTLCALAKMNHRCYFIGSVGDDSEGDFLLESMAGVDCSLVNRSGRSSMCIIVIDRIKNDRALAVVPGTLEINLENPKLETVLKNSHVLHMSSLVQDKGPALQAQLAALCSQECMISFDPGEVYASKGFKAINEILERTSLLFASDLEFKTMFGNRSVMEVITKRLFGSKAWNGQVKPHPFFQEMIPPVLALKSGSKGALLASKTTVIKCPARSVDNIVDNTGAGDAFNAGLIDAIFKGKMPKDALEYSVSIAAFSLMFPGRKWIDNLDNFTFTP